MIGHVKKFVAIMIFLVFAFGIVLSRGASTENKQTAEESDAAKTYKAKCAMCHKAKADKLYNSELSEDEQVQAILKGKKGAKPPDMPAFGTKGITEEKARALVAYMKSLRAAPTTE